MCEDVPSSRRAAIIAALGFIAANRANAQTRGTFVITSGADTVSLEWFVRSPDRVTGEIETRVAGRTSRVTYSVLKDSSGWRVRVEYSLTVPQRGLSTAALDIGPDSAIGPVMLAAGPSCC